MIRTDGYTIQPVMNGGQRGKGILGDLLGFGKKRRKQRGKGIFSDIAKVVGGAGGSALGGLVGAPGLGGTLGSTLAGGLAKMAGGRRKRRAQKGKGVMDMLKKVHDFAKEKKLISKGIDALGYGKKRRARRK